jgi:hypothetical protein
MSTRAPARDTDRPAAVPRTQPPDQTTRAALRLEVGRLRQRERRRRFDTTVFVGAPAGDRAGREVPPAATPILDPGTRAALITSLLEEWMCLEPSPAPPGVWLARPGEPVLQDEDLAWLSAALLAFGSWGLSLRGCWTVTRAGWLDVPTGESRTWKRLRL